MTDAATLLAEFVDALNAGSAPQAADFLARAESDQQRLELAEGIDAALDFVPEEAVHPRGPDGSFVLGASRDAIARAAAVNWPDAVPIWRANAGLSSHELAERVLENGGIEPSDQNVSVARGWIAAIEAGAESVRTVSQRARTSIASALGVAGDAFDAAGDFEPGGALAFRANADAAPGADAADGLIEIAAEIDAAVEKSQEPTEVDSWFSA